MRGRLGTAQRTCEFPNLFAAAVTTGLNSKHITAPVHSTSAIRDSETLTWGRFDFDANLVELSVRNTSRRNVAKDILISELAIQITLGLLVIIHRWRSIKPSVPRSGGDSSVYEQPIRTA